VLLVKSAWCCRLEMLWANRGALRAMGAVDAKYALGLAREKFVGARTSPKAPAPIDLTQNAKLNHAHTTCVLQTDREVRHHHFQ
jgi:hypothetical protein